MSRSTRFKSAVSQISDQQVLFSLLPPVALEKLQLQPEHTNKPSRVWKSQAGKVQSSRYSNGADGRMIIRRDSHQIYVEAFIGERLLFRCGIRDRGLDGMGRAGRLTPLNHFSVNHELANALPHPDFRAVELSVYSYEPDEPLPQGELQKFINDPDGFIFPWKNFRLDTFAPLWREAFDSGLAPWQPVIPIKGFAQHFVLASMELLKQLGYHRMEAVPGWYNAAVFFYHRMNLRFVNLEHQAAFELLERKLQELSKVRPFNIRELSWIVALQNIPEFYLKREFPDYYLGGVHWINSPTSSDYCARLFVDLNDFVPEN